MWRKQDSSKDSEGKLKCYSRDSHNVSREELSSNAVKVLYRLHNAGYRSCLVGGGVRDILLGYHPKDFDIATDDVKLLQESDGYTAVYLEQEKIGMFKKVDTVFIAIKIRGLGKFFRSFVTHGQAISWMLKKGSV